MQGGEEPSLSSVYQQSPQSTYAAQPAAIPRSTLATLSSFTSLPTLGALIAAIAILIVLAFSRRRRYFNKGSSILLTGPSDAGKTAIHSALVFQQVLPSHTTLQPNISLIKVLSPEKQQLRVVRLIDVPGHPRVRHQFKDYLPEAKGVVFVTDASTIARNGAAVAEHLHHILHALTSLPPSHTPPPLVILAHKFDTLSSSSPSNSALAVSRVRTILERELEKRRASQAGDVGVGRLGDDKYDTELAGLECSGTGLSGFRFKDWEGGEVEILGSSVKVMGSIVDAEKNTDADSNLDGLRELREWIQELP